MGKIKKRDIHFGTIGIKIGDKIKFQNDDTVFVVSSGQGIPDDGGTAVSYEDKRERCMFTLSLMTKRLMVGDIPEGTDIFKLWTYNGKTLRSLHEAKQLERKNIMNEAKLKYLKTGIRLTHVLLNLNRLTKMKKNMELHHKSKATFELINTCGGLTWEPKNNVREKQKTLEIIIKDKSFLLQEIQGELKKLEDEKKGNSSLLYELFRKFNLTEIEKRMCLATLFCCFQVQHNYWDYKDAVEVVCSDGLANYYDVLFDFDSMSKLIKAKLLFKEELPFGAEATGDKLFNFIIKPTFLLLEKALGGNLREDLKSGKFSCGSEQ